MPYIHLRPPPLEVVDIPILLVPLQPRLLQHLDPVPSMMPTKELISAGIKAKNDTIGLAPALLINIIRLGLLNAVDMGISTLL
jgi:hypothetical protein